MASKNFYPTLKKVWKRVDIHRVDIDKEVLTCRLSRIDLSFSTDLCRYPVIHTHTHTHTHTVASLRVFDNVSVDTFANVKQFGKIVTIGISIIILVRLFRYITKKNTNVAVNITDYAFNQSNKKCVQEEIVCIWLLVRFDIIIIIIFIFHNKKLLPTIITIKQPENRMINKADCLWLQCKYGIKYTINKTKKNYAKCAQQVQKVQRLQYQSTKSTIINRSM